MPRRWILQGPSCVMQHVTDQETIFSLAALFILAGFCFGISQTRMHVWVSPTMPVRNLLKLFTPSLFTSWTEPGPRFIKITIIVGNSNHLDNITSQPITIIDHAIFCSWVVIGNGIDSKVTVDWMVGEMGSWRKFQDRSIAMKMSLGDYSSLSLHIVEPSGWCSEILWVYGSKR